MMCADGFCLAVFFSPFLFLLCFLNSLGVVGREPLLEVMHHPLSCSSRVGEDEGALVLLYQCINHIIHGDVHGAVLDVNQVIDWRAHLKVKPFEELDINYLAWPWLSPFIAHKVSGYLLKGAYGCRQSYAGEVGA